MFKIKMTLKNGETREFTRKFKSVAELKEWVYMMYILSKVENITVSEN